MKLIVRMLLSGAFYFGTLWLGSAAISQMAPDHWGEFPALLSTLLGGAAGAIFILLYGTQAMVALRQSLSDLPLKARRALAIFVYGKDDFGPFRVFDLRAETEVARFLVAADAFEWAVWRRRIEGPHGPCYEVRNMAGEIVREYQLVTSQTHPA